VAMVALLAADVIVVAIGSVVCVVLKATFVDYFDSGIFCVRRNSVIGWIGMTEKFRKMKSSVTNKEKVILCEL
jgi:hypothetical protein